MSLEKTIVAVLILACLGFAAFTWEESRADLASLKKAIAIQQQIIDAAETREQSRDSNLKITLSQIAAANRTAETPQQIVNALQEYLNLPEPITLGTKPAISEPKPREGSRQSKIGNSNHAAISTPGGPTQDLDRVQPSQSGSPDGMATGCSKPTSIAPTQSVLAIRDLRPEILDFFTRGSHAVAQSATPRIDNPSSTADAMSASLSPNNGASIPVADLKPMLDKIQACQSCEAQRAVFEADLADEKMRSASLTKERDAALTSVKGGSFWHRLKQNSKWLAIGAAAAACASRIR
jgi:hypothetical protein